MIAPGTEAELAEAVASARGPLRILGGGTRPIGRPVAGEALSVAGLSGIELYAPGALTVVARAGTPLAELEAALRAASALSTAASSRALRTASSCFTCSVRTAVASMSSGGLLVNSD